MRKIIWIICAVLFLSACTGNGNVLDPSNITDAIDANAVIDVTDIPDITVDAIFRDTPYVGSSLYKNLWQVSKEDHMDHPALQREVKKIAISYPITTLEQVEQYVNALYEISVSLELLDPKLLDPDLPDSDLISSDRISGTVFIYSDGVIWIGFGPALKPGVIHYDGVSADALISAEDGHVILFDPD